MKSEDKVLIDCEVRNDGEGDAFRAHGRAPSKAYDLRELEIVLGRVAAGSSRSVTIEADLANDPAPRVTWVPFSFSEEGGSAVESPLLRIEAPSRALQSQGEASSRPEIRIAGETHETSAATYRLQAAIRDAVEIRDAWVRISNTQAKVDSKKVMFQRRPDTSPANQLELVSDVPLSAGLNEIEVCTRGKTSDRCERTFMFRLPAGEETVVGNR